MSGSDKFAQILQGKLRALAILAGDTVDPKPGRIIELAPGQAVADDDCCNGQVWVRLANMAPSEGSTPARRPGLDACAVPHYIATVELGATRCAAVVRERSGKAFAPPPGAVTGDGLQGTSDMAKLLEAMTCWGSARSIIGWTPQGPEGGCHGGYWTLTMLVDNCITCAPPAGS